MQSNDRTNAVTGDDPFEVPFRDGLGVPLHSPGSRVTGSVVTNVTTKSPTLCHFQQTIQFVCARMTTD